MGPNGAGKTVLLKALLGILPYSGEIKWGEDAKISYVPQKYCRKKICRYPWKNFSELKKLKRNKSERL